MLPRGRFVALQNRLLRALSKEEFARMRGDLELVDLPQRTFVFEPGRNTTHVYFPETAVISLVNQLRAGGTVEIGTVGREGMGGLDVFLNDDTETLRGVVQIPGTAYRADARTLPVIAASTRPLHALLLRYTQAFLTQVAQTAACNSAHFIEQRCARWLLMTRERVDSDEFPLTHEFVAFMLGVRRSGVTVAMRALKGAGLIQYTRGSVKIVDREGLEGASCECYGTVRSHYARLLPPEPVEE